MTDAPAGAGATKPSGNDAGAQSPHHADVLVLGAGMAGLAAARALADRGRRPVVLEARDRVGGRVWTDRAMVPGLPIELGAEFVHGERAATWELIERLGLRTRRWPKDDESRVRLADGRVLSMDHACRSDPDFAATRDWRLPDVEPGPYEDLRHYLLRIGFTPAQLGYVRRSFANAGGESMHLVSARAAREALLQAASVGKQDHRILDGYDRLPTALAEGLDVRLNARATSIAWGADGVRVGLDRGATLHARAAVVTLPVGVLRGGGIRFDPVLPDAKRRALAGLPMGPVLKLVYVFDEPVTERELMAVYAAQRPPMWWSPSWGRPDGPQAWTAFVSGSMAIDLLERGEEGALDEGLAAFARELERPLPEPVARRLVGWPDDPDTLGGYSVVLAGHHHARRRLAEPTPPLFWAGEASASDGQAATVHGAYLSGLRAARETTIHASGGAPVTPDGPAVATAARTRS